MSENKFTESMEVIETGTMRICHSVPICANFTDVTGVLLDGIAEDSEKLLHEKVEIVPEGTKARMAKLEELLQRSMHNNDELLDVLEAAKQFIQNGIQYGYINMPDKDCGDSALETPAKIEAAIQKARGQG